MRDLRGKVIVITGASSGLGREAAIQLAGLGAKLVLAARREDALSETTGLCGTPDETPLCVPTDVTIEEQVKRLVSLTVEHFGGIDVFINNAGVTLFGTLDEAPFEEHRRVIETNLFGSMLCAREVIPLFKRQQHGTLVNVGSLLSKIGQPFVPSYVISKFGLRGLTETLRTDVADFRDIHVCTLLPYAIDTQHFETGGNRVGREARAMAPVQQPSKVAHALVRLIQRPRRELHVPRFAAFGLLIHAIAPRFVERLLLQVLSEWHFSDARESKSEGSLFHPERLPARSVGTRHPQLGAVGVFGWVARHFVRLLTTPAPRPER